MGYQNGAFSFHLQPNLHSHLLTKYNYLFCCAELKRYLCIGLIMHISSSCLLSTAARKLFCSLISDVTECLIGAAKKLFSLMSIQIRHCLLMQIHGNQSWHIFIELQGLADIHTCTEIENLKYAKYLFEYIYEGASSQGLAYTYVQ